MAEHREADVLIDPNTGRATTYVEHVERPRKSGGWLIGLIVGAVLVIGGIAAYSMSQGGFRQAGAQTDQALSTAEKQSSTLAQNAGAAAGDLAQDAGDQLHDATH